MEYTTVYRVIDQSMKLYWLLFVPFPIISFIILVNWYRKAGTIFSRYSLLWGSLFIITLLSLCIIACREVQAYYHVQKLYNQGEYNTMEGEVSRFRPKLKGHNMPECFNVNDVEFCYNQFDEEYR